MAIHLARTSSGFSPARYSTRDCSTPLLRGAGGCQQIGDVKLERRLAVAGLACEGIDPALLHDALDQILRSDVTGDEIAARHDERADAPGSDLSRRRLCRRMISRRGDPWSPHSPLEFIPGNEIEEELGHLPLGEVRKVRRDVQCVVNHQLH